MKSLLCVLGVIGVLLAVAFSATDAQACNQRSQQVQFQASVAYSQPIAFAEVVSQPVVYQQQFSQVIAQPVVYQQQFQQQAFVQSYSVPQFQNVGCSISGCNSANVRASVRGPRVQRSVSRTRIRG